MLLPPSPAPTLPPSQAQAPHLSVPDPTNDQIELSVVIVSWNVREDLLRCVSALVAKEVREGLTVEIIVVDNGSRDGTVEALAGLPVTVIANDQNLGYGRANNIGLAKSRGKFLLVLNPDTVPQPGSLTKLIQFAASHARAGIVAPQLRNDDGSLQQSAFRFPTLAMAVIDLLPLPKIVPGRLRRWLQESRFNGRYPHAGDAKSPFRIDHPLGACLLIKREAYIECGGFDEKIFMYSEEIELALRYASAGWECWQEPRAVVVHLGGRSTRQLPERMFVELWRSRLYIYAQYYTALSRWFLKLVLLSAMCARLGLGRLKHLVRNPGEQERSEARRSRAVLRMVRTR